MKTRSDKNQDSKLNFKALIKATLDAKANGGGGFFLGYMTDVIVCAFKYHMTYKEYTIYQFYQLEPVDRKKFMMSKDAMIIDEHYNKSKNREIFENKILFIERFSAYTDREYLDLRHCGLNRFTNFCKTHPVIVSKSIQKEAGDFVERHEILETTNLAELRTSLIAKREYLVEPYLTQHDALDKLYPESLNTLRVITFVDDEGDVHILNVALKLGAGGVRDNFSRGGLFSVPDQNGVIVRPFVNKKGSIYELHPSTQEDLMGFQVPLFDEALDFCEKAALELSDVRYVGWDLAIQNDQVLLLDGTTRSKFFQTPPVVTNFTGEEIYDLRSVYKYLMPIIK